MELHEELRKHIESLENAQNSLTRLASDAANKEHYYRIEKAKRVLVERAKGTPVSMLSDLVKGDAEISKLRLDYDIAQGLYDAAKEQINSSKFIARVIHESIMQEYRG